MGKEEVAVAIYVGDRLVDPRHLATRRVGRVLCIRSNPACLMRSIVVRWEDDEDEEELEEIEFGPLKD